MIEIRPCKFCCKSPEYESKENVKYFKNNALFFTPYLSLVCKKCGLSTPMFLNLDDAADAWNCLNDK